MVDEKKAKLIPVRLVKSTGKSALVEWADRKGLHRAFIPVERVAEKIDADLLDAAPPYGVPWADMKLNAPTGDELQSALYAAGYWTADDVYKRAPQLFGVLQALLGLHLGSLVEFAAQHQLNNEVTK